MNLIDDSVILSAAKENADVGNPYDQSIYEKIRAFQEGVEFTQQQLQPFIVEAIEWVYKGDHPYSHDAFCIGENRNKWHDDDGNFITTQQLLEEFINSKTK